MSERVVSSGMRCAVYTRKSTEEGLNQEFNSLDAQRESCEAFIASQKHEGWSLLRAAYDDGGYSGGTLERPALKRLLDDVRSGRIDIVVVYKIDRLTRSLLDFARIVEAFEARRVSFVSVTQAFNTSTPMGRLTLNVLLSFAQFERELTSERIRDKIAASKKKGMWMGGSPPVGYDCKDRKLIINQQEANDVRKIFELYVSLGSIQQLKRELDRAGMRTKRRVSQGGRVSGGLPFWPSNLRALLQNPAYMGRVRHKRQVYPGEHIAIVDESVWHRAQEQLAASDRDHLSGVHAREQCLLLRCVYDPAGNLMESCHTTTHGKRYRYYASRSLSAGMKEGTRIPAIEIETIVLEQIAYLLSDHSRICQLLRIEHNMALAIGSSLVDLETRFSEGTVPARRLMLKYLLQRVDITATGLLMTISVDALARAVTGAAGSMRESLVIEVETRFRLHAEKEKFTTTGAASDPPETAALIQAIDRARKWFRMLTDGRARSIHEIAHAEKFSPEYVNKIICLAFLSPRIVETVLSRRQTTNLTLDDLLTRVPLSLDWRAQETEFGIAP